MADRYKDALDVIGEGLDLQIGLNVGVGVRGVTEWFVTAELFQRVIQQLNSQGIGYDKVLRAVDFVLDMIRTYGPDLAAIIQNVILKGREFLNAS